MPSRPLRLCFLAMALALGTSCQREVAPPIELQVGPQSLHSFTPKTALAHFEEHPTQPDVLKLVFANYELGCQRFTAPEAGDVFVTVTVEVPPGREITPGSFGWDGDVTAFAKGEANGALPFVRLFGEGRALPPGGELRLDAIDKKLHGVVSGELRFQDGGDGEPRTTGLHGAFAARICQLSLDASRRQNQD